MAINGQIKATNGLKWSLNDPDMGEYERAGLAGLYMSLRGAEKWIAQDLNTHPKQQAKELQTYIRWDVRDPHSVSLEWQDETKAIIKLVEWAWQVHEGVFFLPAIHCSLDEYENIYLRVPIHAGLLSTYFQHGKVIQKTGSKEKVEELEAL